MQKRSSDAEAEIRRIKAGPRAASFWLYKSVGFTSHTRAPHFLKAVDHYGLGSRPNPDSDSS
jgi:hypothetical protein